MKTILVILILLIAVPVFSGELWVRALNSETYPCDGQIREDRWINEGPPIRVKRLVTWIGATKGAIVEVSACTYRLSNWMGLSCVGWDRYAQPTGLHQWAEDFGENWVEISTGDALVLQTWCKQWGSIFRSAHVGVMFYYTFP